MINELKKELENLNEMRFSLDMKDYWNCEDEKKDKKMFDRIQEIIMELEQKGIKANYKHGYQITYENIKGVE